MKEADIRRENLTVIGWREWVRLPDLGLSRIKAKIDTGAKSSSLHAYDIEIHECNGFLRVRFRVQPRQNDRTQVIETEAAIHEFRRVRSSSGHITNRPVIRTHVEIFGHRSTIDVTLFDRAKMGFRMLIGREALRDRFLVDPRLSYCGGKPKLRTRRPG